MNREKRSTGRGIGNPFQFSLPLAVDAVLSPDHSDEGGGSARAIAPPLQGGGYQNIYTEAVVSKKKRAIARQVDPRLEDLRVARLGPVWLRIADVIGYDAFLAVWQTLLDFPGVQDDRSRVYVPCIEKFLAAQRHLLMRSLIAAGLTPAQIRQEMLAKTGQAPHVNTILRHMA